MSLLANLALRHPRNIDASTLGRDAMAGAISAVVQIAYCISFAALIFTGDLASGFSLGLAGLIMGTVVTCVVIALTSTFSPVIGGPDSPAVAVMSVLAASIATALAAKGAPTGQIVINVLVALSVSTLLTGILLYGVGALKMGQWLRFIPYPVIGGFLAASGILLITGGMEVVTQTNLTLSPSSWQVLYSPLYAPQILIGALFAASIPVLGRFVPNYLALPIAFFGFLLVLDVSLFGFFNDATIHSAWFLPSLGELTLWWPINAMIGQQVDWGVIARSWPFLAEGMALSALLVAVATAGGLVLGFGLALMRRSRHALVAAPATAYVTVMRTVPLILVLFWFYFLVPLVIGRPVGSLASALIAFVLFEAAFYCEIIRSAIGSVRAGQTEAALATGMKRWQVMRYVVLPQGLKAMTPLLLNQVIIVFQDTSLVYVVALRDFMTTASVVASRDGRPTEMYTLVAVVYLAICFSLAKAVERYGKARST